ncbi:MAG: bifunctional ornithine acetyltransferase/N-acetylglutamate synthase, partial [Planctomycetes bacterium]|nr:bifunctional ornithine acetyltransferase/N-acetylglutamate synthase [Planctomycetota bacterium]
MCNVVGHGKETTVEPVAAGLTTPKGFLAAGLHCGIKPDPEVLDLGLIYSEHPAAVAATFTTNRVHAAAVRVNRERVASGRAQAVVVNSGNANACTGARGLEDAHTMTRLVAEQLRLEEAEVLVASTGIIGEYLPMDKIEIGIAGVAGALGRSPEADGAISRA